MHPSNTLRGSSFREPFAFWPAGGIGVSGLVADDEDARFRSRIYAVEPVDGDATLIEIPPVGACFGYVQEGEIGVHTGGTYAEIEAGHFFVTRNGAEVMAPAGNARAVVIQQLGYLAIPQLGGPIEGKGRLRYIDRCSDSLLIGPPLFGDPCLNHLHFPPGIDQTAHTHPSTRAGIVARGRGICRLDSGEFPLEPGTIFWIPTGGLHAFKTEGESMDVIAYHPDSDFGPQHENHPMVNRTLVDGSKIDNSAGVHVEAETEPSRFIVDG